MNAPPIRCFYALTLCALQIIVLTITITITIGHRGQVITYRTWVYRCVSLRSRDDDGHLHVYGENHFYCIVGWLSLLPS